MASSLWGKLKMAGAAALNVLTSPTDAAVKAELTQRRGYYNYLWAWETSSVFDAPRDARTVAVFSTGEGLTRNLRLYRHTRLVWNPFPRITGFWADTIYAGAMTRDGLPLPNGTPSAVPLPADTDKALRAAASQIWAWSGMGSLKAVIPYWAAIAGNMGIEIVDDLVHQRVVLQPHTAGRVKDLELSNAGDVRSVVLEYSAVDSAGKEYMYRQEMTKTTFRTFRDGKPYDYTDGALGAEYDNLWGFVPFCWVPHRPRGSEFAAPAIGSALNELLEINSLQSMIDDSVARATKPIPWFATDGNPEPLGARRKRKATDEFSAEDMDSDRESFTGWKLPPGTVVGKLDPSMNIGDGRLYLADRQAEFLRKFPEVSMWESLRERDVSGIAAEILHGDTVNKVATIRSGTDRQVEKATQMAISIAAVRQKHTWRNQTTRHKVFVPFDERSWKDSKLDFEIDSRPLIPEPPPTKREEVELADVKLNKLGLPKELVYTELGVPKKYIPKVAEEEAAIAQAKVAQNLPIQAGPQPQATPGVG